MPPTNLIVRRVGFHAAPSIARNGEQLWPGVCPIFDDIL
jgi:hypothetical protein